MHCRPASCSHQQQRCPAGAHMTSPSCIIHASIGKQSKCSSRMSACISACRHLVSKPGLVCGKRVLEIGSGCGLCGMLALKLQAQEVSSFLLPAVKHRHWAVDAYSGLCNQFDGTRASHSSGSDVHQQSFPVLLSVHCLRLLLSRQCLCVLLS